jgi:hypothetical protein
MYLSIKALFEEEAASATGREGILGGRVSLQM